MLKIYIERKYRMNESFDAPCEGIFWVINNELIAFTEQIDTSGKWSTDLEHYKLWSELQHKFTVNNKTVDYNYFPRGRVMVNPIRDKNNNFLHYDVFIYIDNCINKSEIVNDIIYEFRLNNPKCNIKYIGADGGITSNHYTCHNCK